MECKMCGAVISDPNQRKYCSESCAKKANSSRKARKGRVREENERIMANLRKFIG
jgi:hypothetical protein